MFYSAWPSAFVEFTLAEPEPHALRAIVRVSQVEPGPDPNFPFSTIVRWKSARPANPGEV